MRLIVRVSVVAALVTAVAAPSTLETWAQVREPGSARTDHQSSGNRVAVGTGPISDWSDIDLDGVPTWVLPSPAQPGNEWLVVLADGEVVAVAEDGRQRSVGSLEPGVPPLASSGPDGGVSVMAADAASALGKEAIPHARVVSAADGTSAVLAGPTDRYAHGVLGDEVEASAVVLTSTDGRSVRIEVGTSEVIEGIAPMLADLDGDGIEEVIVTVSDEASGARLRAYTLDGEYLAESDPIGRGYRWRHQIAAAAIGPAAEVEIVAVRTPHIGGTVEAFRLAGDRLEIEASLGGFSSHRIGSPNLDMALLADVDGDERLDVVVPTDDMRSLGGLSRSDDGFDLVASLPLDGVLATNLSAASDEEGHLLLAAGTADGRLRIFR